MNYIRFFKENLFKKYLELPFFILVLSIFILMMIFAGGCSIEGFRDFKVDEVSLLEDSVIGTDRGSIKISFNKEVDKESIYNSIRVEEEGGSQVSIDFKIDKNEVVVTPAEKWAPHKRYWLIIDKDARDIYGKKMLESYYLSFRSTDDPMPVSGVIIEPDIQTGGVNTDIDGLTIAFSGPVDTASIERAFSISPDAEGSFNWISDRSFSYIFNNPLAKNSLYNVYISDKGLDAEGFPVKEFNRSFEYCPNTPYPMVDTLLIGGVTAFDRNAPGSYSLQDDCYFVDVDGVEKDTIIRVNFTSDMDKESFLKGFEISPSVDWSTNWVDDRTVDVSFDEDLKLEEDYKIKLGKDVKSNDGLSFLYKYLIAVRTNGQFSRYLDFYAADFTGLVVDADISSGGNAIVNTGVSIDEDSDGYYIRINYNDSPSPEEIDVALKFTLRFLSDGYSPDIKKNTVQDSANYSFVVGTNPNTSSKTGNIAGFDWPVGNECLLSVEELATDNIYHLHLAGGTNAVEDEYRNYLRNDIDYYFKLIVEHD